MPTRRKKRIVLPMHEGTGNPVDATARGNNMTLIGSPSWEVDVDKGNVVRLAGGAGPYDSGRVDADASWNPATCSRFRFSMKARPDPTLR